MTKKRRQPTCGEVARARAQKARQRSRSAGRSFLEGEILFGVVLVSSLMAGLLMAPFPRRRQIPHDEVILIVRNRREEGGDDRPPNEYELGVPSPFRRRELGQGRYSSRPSYDRLMKDLRRPASRCEALSILCQRVDDPETRAWVNRRVHEDDINRLAIHVRPGVPEYMILQAWRAEVDADLAAAAVAAEGVTDLRRIAQAVESLRGDAVPGGPPKGTAPSTGFVPDLG
ncbi:hypothetical protein J4G37_19160 [Microvirga sp. 3-52]|nr:hypothetical protein [Microvirga sp. 3-52]